MGNFFGAPAMLWWAAAASVPIAIHLLSRRRYKRLPWAAMELINRAFKKTRKRLRLENLLLLLLRILALLLFALALADPRLDGGKLFGGNEGSRNVIMILDASFSMDTRDQSDQSAFARAKKLAAELAGDLNPERDAGALIGAASPSQLNLPLTHEIDRLRSSIDSMKITAAATDLLGSLRIAAGLLAEPGLETEYPGSRTVYCFTDMQKLPFVTAAQAQSDDDEASSPEIALGDIPDPALEKVLRDLFALQARVVFVDVGDDSEERRRNIAVSALEHSGKTLVAGIETDFEVRVANFSNNAEGGEIQFFVDQEKTFAQSERIEDLGPRQAHAGTEVALSFSAKFDRPGWHYVAARYLEDALPIDNIRRFAFYVRERIKVLAVSGKATAEPEDAAAFFVTRALDPFVGGHQGNASFSVKEMNAIEIGGERFADYDLILLADVAQLSAPKLKELENFVSAGGSCMFFAGASFETPGRMGAQGGSSNELFYRDGEGLLPARLIAALGSDEFTENPYAVQFDSFDHPATAYFEDKKVRPGITRIPVYKFVSTDPDLENHSVRVLSSFRATNAQNSLGKTWPAVIEKRFGAGRTILITTSADRSWNLLGASPAFVPFIREMAYYLTRDTRRANLTVGEPLEARFGPTVTSVRVQRGNTPTKNLSPTLTANSQSAVLAIGRLSDCELIRMDYDDTNGEDEESMRLFAVNVNPEESDLNRVGSGWLKLQFGDELLTVVRQFDEIVEESNASEKSRLWRFFLYLVLGALVLETILAQRFSRKQSIGGATA